MSGLTPQMAACLEAVQRLTVDGVPPTYEAMRVDLGLSSKSRVFRLLTCLKERGYVDWRPKGQQSIQVLKQTANAGWLTPERIATWSDDQLRTVADRVAAETARRAQ